MVDSLRHPNKEVKIALVGKYIALHDAYISVVEALKHGGIAERATVDLHWIDSETLNDDNAKELLGDMAGIIVPGGFGSRSDLWADPSITRNAVGKYRCDRLIPPLRSSGSDLYGRDRQYKNTQFIKTAYRVA